MTFQEALDHEFLRLYGREVPEPEWEIMEHPQRAVVIGARCAATWNLDYRYTVAAICKFTDLTRPEALTFYALHFLRKAEEHTHALITQREPWK